MRKLKNVELVGKTRLIPGVGHVVMAAEMHEYVADACDAAGLDWFEAGELVTGDDGELVTGELVTGDDGELVTGELVTGDDGELVTGELVTGGDGELVTGELVTGAEAQNGRKKK